MSVPPTVNDIGAIHSSHALQNSSVYVSSRFDPDWHVFSSAVQFGTDPSSTPSENDRAISMENADLVARLKPADQFLFARSVFPAGGVGYEDSSIVTATTGTRTLPHSCVVTNMMAISYLYGNSSIG